MTAATLRSAAGIRAPWSLSLGLSALLAVLLVVSLFAGAVSIPATTIADALLGRNATFLR